MLQNIVFISRLDSCIHNHVISVNDTDKVVLREETLAEDCRIFGVNCARSVTAFYGPIYSQDAFLQGLSVVQKGEEQIIAWCFLVDFMHFVSLGFAQLHFDIRQSIVVIAITSAQVVIDNTSVPLSLLFLLVAR